MMKLRSHTLLALLVSTSVTFAQEQTSPVPSGPARSDAKSIPPGAHPVDPNSGRPGPMWEVKTQNTYRPYTDLLFIDILSTDQRHHNYPLRDPEALEPDHSRVNQAVMPPQNSVGDHDRLELIDLFRDSADVVGIEVYFDGEMTFEDALRGGNGGYPQHYSHAVVGRP